MKLFLMKCFVTNYSQCGEAEKIIILLTDGSSTNLETSHAAADNASVQHVKIISVALGPDVNEIELSQLTTDPDDENMYLPHGEPLESFELSIAEAICPRMYH